MAQIVRTEFRVMWVRGPDVAIVVPGWDPGITVILSREKFPSVARMGLGPEQWFSAQMNIAADTIKHLDIKDIKPATKPD